MAASTKMSVDISAFKQGMQEATARVKTLDAEMKKAEAQFKNTGDAEAYMTQKAQTLQEKIKAQKDAVANLEKAMKAMKDNGVSETSAQYQKLAERLATAQAAMIETTTELNNLGQSEQEAARGADQLTQSVNGIGKKISLDQVISGINTITGGLEKAAGKAVDLGKALWENVMDSARWADDTATMALMYGVDLDTFLRVQKLVAEGMDTSVEAILNSQARLKRNIGSGSDSIKQTLNELGINTHEILQGKYGTVQGAAKDVESVFWEVGRAIMNLGDEYEKENKAQELFGKSWKELVPLFSQYGSLEEYKDALANTTVNTEEEVSKLAELNDAVGKLQSNFDVLENKVMAGLAPGLTAASNALSGLLDNLIAYLETPAGQEALTKMSDAVTGLFEDLGKIDPEQVVEGFSKVFGDIVNGIRWLDENKETLKTVLGTIVGGWGAAKLMGGAVDVLKLVNGIRGLTGGGAAAAGAAGAATGASWGAAFASAALKAAPWLAGIYILTEGIFEGTHDELGNNTLYNKDGSLSAEGQTVINPDGTLKREGWEIGDMRQRQRAALEALWDEYRAGLSGAGNSEAFGAATKTVQELFGGEAGLFQSMMQQMHEWGSNGSWKDMADLPEDFFQFEVQPKVDENAAAQIAEEIGTVAVPVVMVPTTGGDTGRIRTPRGWITPDGSHVNGLPFAPFDGYIAELHRGERIVPARENVSRNFSSNLYIESMYMNNGTDAQALAQSIAAANRRSMAGYGS